MLVHLSVHNYAIVEHLDLELDRGMSVITGETGAGKSIMLDALGLTLGDRADSGVVRPGADKADILATFDLADIPEASAWLAERDLRERRPVHPAPGRSPPKDARAATSTARPARWATSRPWANC